MRVETHKQRGWSDELLERAVEFHGHGGPMMVVGLRMGLAALRRLEVPGWFGLHCLAMLRWGPPDSCVIDGIQTSTGCTMGKGNMEVREREGIAAVFTKDNGTRLRIVLRREALGRIRAALENGDDALEPVVGDLIAASDDDLFEFHNS